MSHFGSCTSKTMSGRASASRSLALAASALVLGLLATASPSQARFDADPPNDEGGGSGNPSIPPAFVRPAEGFDWRAPNRYSQWTTAWSERGRVTSWATETYDPEYVNPTKWKLYFQGCDTEADFRYDIDPANNPPGGNKYRWKWNGKTRDFSSDCYTELEFPAQGVHQVQLQIRDSNGHVTTWDRPVQVKDRLIVVLGDSFASGEGAPDSPVKHFEGPGANADWADDRCHRSAYSGGAQAAKIIEEADPHTSVTFLSFACSGATLITPLYEGSLPFDPYFVTNGFVRGMGITEPYVGIEPPRDADDNYVNMLPAQTQALYQALSRNGSREPRKVDALIATGGINDVRFSSLAAVCMFTPTCFFTPVGFPPLPLDLQFNDDLGRVTPGWGVMNEQLEGYGIEIDKKLALEYPPFFHDDDGSQCLLVFEDILTPIFSWTVDEIAWADAYWAKDLNTAVKNGADNNDFDFVGGIASDFHNHGWCADNRYVNTATDSINRQGDDAGDTGTFAFSTTGLAHPNANGYAAVAARILDHMTEYVDNLPPVGVSDKIWASDLPVLPNFFNVLANDYDPNLGDTLIVVLDNQPAHGTVVLAANGDGNYKPKYGYEGPDSFRYILSDGVYSRFVTVEIDVRHIVITPAKVGFGSTTEIGDLLGGVILDGPYQVVFDFDLEPERGNMRPVLDEDKLVFTAPPRPRGRRIKMPYTVYSLTTDRTSPDYGRSVRGLLKLNMRRRVG